MNKYILDTSALIGNPSAWESYPNSTVIIPIASVNELDKLKKQPGQVGRNARVCIRKIDEISAAGNITCGIKLEDNIILIVDATYHDLSKPQFAGFGDASYGDTQILACAYSHLKKNQGSVTLISNDINLRLKAKSHNMQATGQEDTEGDTNEIYSGVQAVLNEDAGLALQKNKVINPEDYNLELSLNEFVIFENLAGDELSLGRKVSDTQIRQIKRHSPWGITARNNEQTLALDLLMDPKIDLVTLIGKAGSGKSLIALAAAMELVINRKEYDKLVIYRPIQPVGNDIGYMPGTKEEKLAPWFQAIMDSFEFLFSNKKGDWRRDLEMFQRKGQIEMEALTYIRGRSISNTIILIDESQNISKEDIKTILTRAGEGSKLILTGDIEQIDAQHLDFDNNGLHYVIDKFKDINLAGHVTFKHGERSRLANLAATIL